MHPQFDRLPHSQAERRTNDSEGSVLCSRSGARGRGAGSARAAERGRRPDQEGARHPRQGDHARYTRRHQPVRLHGRTQLHAAARHPGQPAEDGRRRPRRRLPDRLRRPAAAAVHARRLRAERLRARLQGGDREVRRRAPPHRDHRARQDRPGAHRGRRPPHRRERPEGRAHRRRERLSARHQPRARAGVLRPRRTLHVARAQRPQPALGLEHRRDRRLEVERACRRSASRSSPR